MKPEVIAIGEIRDPDIMRTVIKAAETGHLIIGTMHASTVYQAIDRIITQAGTDARIVRQMLANNLLCIIAQNLLPAADSNETTRSGCFAMRHSSGPLSFHGHFTITTR